MTKIKYAGLGFGTFAAIILFEASLVLSLFALVGALLLATYVLCILAERKAMRDAIVESSCQAYLDWARETNSMLRGALLRAPKCRSYFARWYYP